MKLSGKLSVNRETLVRMSEAETHEIAGARPVGSRFGCETCGIVCGNCVSAPVTLTGGSIIAL